MEVGGRTWKWEGELGSGRENLEGRNVCERGRRGLKKRRGEKEDVASKREGRKRSGRVR